MIRSALILVYLVALLGSAYVGLPFALGQLSKGLLQ